MPENNFYVYEHWRPDKGLPFYVGKGKKGRADFVARSNKYHQKIRGKLRRLGLSVEVRRVFTGLDEEMAFALECSQISYWRYRNIVLVNRTNGGEGTTGYRPTPEQLANKSKATIASWKDPEIRERQSSAIRTGNRSAETRLLRSISAKKLWADPAFRAKMIAAQTKAQRRPKLRKHQSRIQTERQSAPEFRAKMSAIITEVWKRPEFRASMSAAKERKK